MAKPEKYKHINFKPPVSVSNAAKTALEWKEKYKNEVKGGTQVGWTRANQLANREELSPETIKRMKAFFDRHQGNEKVKAGDKPWEDNGKVAWLIWGGDPGYSWAKKVVKQMESADKKREAAQRIAYMFIQAKDKIPGGLADKKSPEDFDKAQLEKGIKVELEHTNDKSVAKEIAMDHLTEDPKYYDKLEKIESHKTAEYTSPATQSSGDREIVEYRIYDKQTKQQVGRSYDPPRSEYHKNRARTQAEKMNQQYGSIRYVVKPIFSDDPSLKQKTAIDFTSISPTLNPDRPMTVRELARAIRLAITAEHDAVQLYELIADSTPDVAVRKIMQDVANEEKEHVGEFEELLARIDPENEHFVGEGVQEAEELITEKYAFTLEDILDRAADKLERKGLKKEAYIIDTVTNTVTQKTAFDIIEKLKGAISKIPGAQNLMLKFKGKTPKQVVESLLEDIGDLNKEEFEAAKQIAVSKSIKQASIMDAFRDKKKALMSAVLITMLSGMAGKAVAQMDFDDFERYKTKMEQDFRKSTQQMKENFERNTQEMKRNFEKFKKSIDPDVMDKSDPSEVPDKVLKEAPVKDTGDEEKTIDIKPQVAKAVADSIIDEDADSLAKHVLMPFSVSVNSFDYRKDADKIKDPKERQLAIATKAVFSNVRFKSHKGINDGIVEKINPDILERIRNEYSVDNMYSLIMRAFGEKIKNNEDLLSIFKNPNAKDMMKKEILEESNRLARQFIRG